VKEARGSVSAALDHAIKPLETYLQFFERYQDFINIDNEAYMAKMIKVTHKDPENTEIELPVTVELDQVTALLNQHQSEVRDIELNFPTVPIHCGLFQIDVASVRQLLLEKHKAIVKLVLSRHRDYGMDICQYLDEEFKKINRNLSKRPENVEQLVELEEYVSGLSNTIAILHECIQHMMAHHNLLDDFKFRTDADHIGYKWSIFGAPAKVAVKCGDVAQNNINIKLKFRDDMMGDQALFGKSLIDLEAQVSALEAYTDLADVVETAAKVRDVENKISVAQAKARLFNSREGLFELDATDYEALGKIQKSFEPYYNLWQTSTEWLEKSRTWMSGRFIDLNPDEVEREVEKYFVSINKAAKYFTRVDLKEQSAISNLIKAQVTNFRPEVPLIVTLRNPGMRERHWQKIAEQLNVQIMPIEDFSTQEIVSLNLKDNLELIQKIGESAAKEYQIEQALDKMEKEWENMMLSIHSYRETGTGIIKGVDDINVILDEQITMTQVSIYIYSPSTHKIVNV
jgi:dynein heavy chain